MHAIHFFVLLAIVANIQAKQQECIPACARHRFPNGLRSSCEGMRGLVAAWYADKMDEMRVGLSGYPSALSDARICISECILSGDLYVKVPTVTANFTSPPRSHKCSSYLGSFEIDSHNNWGFNAGIKVDSLQSSFTYDPMMNYSSCGLTGEIIWLDNTGRTATCITFYRRGSSCTWPGVVGGPSPRSGQTYCKSNIQPKFCGTAHAELYFELTGHCPGDEPENLVMSGGTVCNNAYSGRSNTFNNGQMPWADKSFYDGTNNEQDPEEFFWIIAKTYANNQQYAAGRPNTTPLYSYNLPYEKTECPCSQ